MRPAPFPFVRGRFPNRPCNRNARRAAAGVVPCQNQNPGFRNPTALSELTPRMTAKGQPRHPFDPAGDNIETAARVSPPARAAAKPVIPAKVGIQNRGARRRTGVPGQSMRGFRVSQGRPLPGAAPQFENRPFGGGFASAAAGRSRTTPTGFLGPGGMRIRRGQPRGLCPPTEGPNHRSRRHRRARNGAQECAPYGRFWFCRGRIYASRAVRRGCVAGGSRTAPADPTDPPRAR